MVSWIWPTDFPTDCPPGDARPTNGTYYHIVKSDPPGPRDFVSQYHQNRRLAENNVNRGYATLCETMGLSTFADINDAVDCFHQYPQLGDKITRLTLGQEAGKVKATPRYFWESHHTWWKNQVFDPTGSADVVASRWPRV
jgi:hypothetical protein